MCGCYRFGASVSVYFFVFKQKTAYEMRISDWSSDVCSSDLAVAVLAPEGHARLHRRGVGLHPCVHPDADALVVDPQAHVDPWQLRQDPDARPPVPHLPADTRYSAKPSLPQNRSFPPLPAPGRTPTLQPPASAPYQGHPSPPTPTFAYQRPRRPPPRPATTHFPPP